MVRAKFRCGKKEEDINGFVIYMQPVTEGSEENKQFFKWTPWGELKMGTVNQYAADQFIVGKEYYLDIILAE